MSVLRVEQAHKVYRRLRKPPERALNGLDLDVPEGGVFGFLGPNGSGKTTTIRMALGLIRPTSGRIWLLGREVPRALPAAMPQVGSLVELPTLFPGFTGRENLRLLARVAGLPNARVEECLELVGLRDRAGDRVKGYSLGMKQRLGIGAALLKRPRLLVLDEPTNGLDPGGIAEVRDLLHSLGASGHTTVFLSSHLLGEVQQTCDRVAILSRGRCVASGLVSEVLAARQTATLRVRLGDASAGAVVLQEAGLTVTPDTSAPGLLTVEGATEPAAVTRLLADRGHYLSELTPVMVNLETVFLELTGAGGGPGTQVAAPTAGDPAPSASPQEGPA